MALVFEANKKPEGASSSTVPVFTTGNYTVTSITVETSSSSQPPKPLLILSPTLKGSYPVLLFLHGFYLKNQFYSQLLSFISSHGFIVVAPQLYLYFPPKGTEEVESAAKVANWLSTGLGSVIPEGVYANLAKLALAGHSRGGKTAFALALGYAQTTLKFSVLIGVDPVAGMSKNCRTDPKILTYKPRSFDLSIPVTVVGTGLGDVKRNCCMPPCAPDEVNHKEFFYECKPPCYHFVAKEYGHMDMLDDNPQGLVGVMADCMCKNGTNPRELMRSGVGGIVVATLKAYLEGQDGDLAAIVAQPDLAPIVLDPVEFVSS